MRRAYKLCNGYTSGQNCLPGSCSATTSDGAHAKVSRRISGTLRLNNLGAQGQCRTIADVGVVGLGEKRDDGGTLVGHAHEEEAQVEDRSAAHIIGHIADGKVEQLLDGPIVGRSAIRHAHHKHAAVPAHQNGLCNFLSFASECLHARTAACGACLGKILVAAEHLRMGS